MGRIVGIDLGTSTSEIAIYENGAPRILPNREGRSVTPSAIWQAPSGELIVGDNAKGQPGAAVEFKRKMGEQHLVSIGKQRLPPEDCSSLIVRHLVAYATEDLGGETIDRAVITVPAKWKEGPRRATEAAGRTAGLTVERLINEPTAAAIAFGTRTDSQGQVIAVYDLGGGTFDITILKTTRHGVLDVVTSEGDPQLGGTDFDDRLMQWCLAQTESETGFPVTPLDLQSEELSKLRKACEKAKQTLSYSPDAPIYGGIIGTQNGQPVVVDMEVHRGQFEALIEEYIAKTIEWLQHAMRNKKISKREIDELILVGGSTRIPLVRQRVAEFLGKEPNSRDVNPDEAVALGAAIQASIVAGDAPDDAPIVIDTNNHALGVEVATIIEGKLVDGVFSPIIPKDVKLPTKKMEQYATLVDNQDAVLVQCYQGEHPVAAENEAVGDAIEIRHLPPKPAGETRVEVTFGLGVNGTLDVEVNIPEAGLGTSKQFTLDRGFHPEAEVGSRRASLDELWKSSELAKKYKALIERCESLLERSPDKTGEKFRAELKNLKEAILKGDEASADAADMRLSYMIFETE